MCGMIALTLLAGVLAAPASEPPQPLPFALHAAYYSDVRDLLLPGDVAYAIASRNPVRRGTAQAAREPEWSPSKFSQALAELAAADLPGLIRSLVFSSVRDLEREIAALPPSISIVAYNSEPGMTPPDELQDIANRVQRFAAVARAHGRRATWGPTSAMLSNDPALLDLARHVDALGLQHQRVLQSQGLDAFLALTQERGARIKAANPDCEVNVQVVLERTPAPDAIAAFRAAETCVDRVGVWTMRDRAGLRAVLGGLRDLRQGRLQPAAGN